MSEVEAVMTDSPGEEEEKGGLRVAVVDDDEFFRESLSRNLMDAGFRVRSYSAGQPALEEMLGGREFDLVLLDWKMPGLNGLEVLRRMREGGVGLPVIFLTVLSDQIYEESALQHGAVDFVDKSRSFSILLKRIEITLKGLKRREEGEEEESHLERLGPLELRRDVQRATWRGMEVALTLNEFRIVEFLAERSGRDVKYREIYDLVHGQGFLAGAGADGYRANVRTFIKRIRQKFRDIDPTFEAIENYPGFGYRWRADG